MAGEDWRDRQEERDRRRSEAPGDRDDFGQADYSRDYGYDPRSRSGYRSGDDRPVRGPADGGPDYTADWGYDPARGAPQRNVETPDRGAPPAGRSWRDRAGEFFGGGRPRFDEGRPAEEDRRFEEERRARSRAGSSDRVLWAVIMERLESDRRLDLHDVEVIVDNGEVTLNGAVRRKEDKRRIEDIADDVNGVRNVQNNLRPRDRDRNGSRDRGWTFL